MAPPLLVKGYQIPYVKSYYLAPFSYFDIDSSITADFYYYFELIDKNHLHTVEVKEWCDSFCPYAKSIFLCLWKRYYYGRKTFVLRNTKMAGIGSVKYDEIHFEEEFKRPDYTTFACFLLLLMSISGKKENARFLFWLWFQLDDNVFITGNNLTSMLSELYSEEQLDVKENKRFQKLSLKLQKLTKVVDGENFRFTNFVFLDMQLGESFIKRIVKVQEQIHYYMLDKKIWSTLMNQVRALEDEEMLDMARRRLRDHVPADRVTSRTYGDRKKNLDKLTLFIEMFENYVLSSSLADDEGDNINAKKAKSFKQKWKNFYRDLRSFWEDVPDEPEEDEDDSNMNSNDLHTEIKNADAGSTFTMPTDVSEDNTSRIAADDMISLTQKFRRELRWPLEKVYASAKRNIKIALERRQVALMDVIPVEKIDLSKIIGPNDEGYIEGGDNNFYDDDDKEEDLVGYEDYEEGDWEGVSEYSGEGSQYSGSGIGSGSGSGSDIDVSESSSASQTQSDDLTQSNLKKHKTGKKKKVNNRKNSKQEDGDTPRSTKTATTAMSALTKNSD